MTKARLLFLISMSLFIAACEQPPVLERIKANGELIVATRVAPTTYFVGPHGFTGLEYDLANLFAAELGVKPRFETPQPFEKILTDVRTGRAHMGAAGLTITPERTRALQFSRPYQRVTQQLVYRHGNDNPDSFADLGNDLIEVVAGSSHEENLAVLRRTRHPQLNWRASNEHSSQALLNRVDRNAVAYTIADSNELTIMRRYLAYLRPGFDISEPESIAWAFSVQPDSSLLEAANAFFKRIEKDGTLQRLLDHYFGRIDHLSFVQKRDFWRHVNERLSHYRSLFERAAKEVGIDWRLLAAVGYQESHWNTHAVSPTGVRGIMMLTKNTADQLGLTDRADPEESIFGGARYLRIVDKKIPARIPAPDRLWLALAGYNVGFGHLEDARILTQRHGGNPDRWMDVKQSLPLLSKKKYYKTLKRGFARGQQAVTFVENIRSYYDMLVHYSNKDQPLLKKAEIKPGAA